MKALQTRCKTIDCFPPVRRGWGAAALATGRCAGRRGRRPGEAAALAARRHCRRQRSAGRSSCCRMCVLTRAHSCCASRQGHVYRSSTDTLERWFNPDWISLDHIPHHPRGPAAAPGGWQRVGRRGEERRSRRARHRQPGCRLAAATHVWHSPAALAQQTFIDAVVKRLMSDAPLAILLSGGLDSSLVASVAVRHIKEAKNAFDPDHKLHTYSIGIAGAGGAGRGGVAAARVCACVCGVTGERSLPLTRRILPPRTPSRSAVSRLPRPRGGAQGGRLPGYAAHRVHIHCGGGH